MLWGIFEIFGVQWDRSSSMGYFRDFWGEMGMIECYGVFLRFLGYNGTDRVLWGIFEIFGVKWI